MRQLLLAMICACALPAQEGALPRLHHVGLNSTDPEGAAEWYRTLWPRATRAAVDGEVGVQAEMLLLFRRVERAPAGGWRDDLHRADVQGPFWHIGAFANSSDLMQLADRVGAKPLPLFVAPDDTGSVWRSGLVPYAGTLTREKVAGAPRVPPREGGFSYLVGPDGVLFEVTGGPETRPSLSHVHFYHEQPLCAANWYAEVLGAGLPLVRDSAGREAPRAPWSPCEVANAEPTWPSLEPAGTIRAPAGAVRLANGTMSWYPRQCTGTRCGSPQPLVPTRGQVLDHVGLEVTDYEAVLSRLRARGVATGPAAHRFPGRRSVMVTGPDGLAIELVEAVAGR